MATEQQINYLAYCYECQKLKGNGQLQHVKTCIEFHRGLCTGPIFVRVAGPRPMSENTAHKMFYTVQIHDISEGQD